MNLFEIFLEGMWKGAGYTTGFFGVIGIHRLIGGLF